MTQSAIIEARGLTKKFGGYTAIPNLSLAIERGKVTAVIGPNGAGKSTLFNMLSGAMKPTGGQIVYEGRDVTELPYYDFAGLGIARSFQISSVFPELTALENVRLAAQALTVVYDFWSPVSGYTDLRQQAQDLLEAVGLTVKQEAKAGTLAHGDQRALEIAMALASRPKLLLLDEPTAGMSPAETTSITELIRKLAATVTVVLVEHKMDLVMSISDDILVLHHGELVARGSPADIVGNLEVRRIYLGERRL